MTRGEALAPDLIQEHAGQRHAQEDALVHQVVEPAPSRVHGMLEIEHPETQAELVVRLRLEHEAGRVADVAQDGVGVLIADGHPRVQHVGYVRQHAGARHRSTQARRTAGARPLARCGPGLGPPRWVSPRWLWTGVWRWRGPRPVRRPGADGRHRARRSGRHRRRTRGAWRCAPLGPDFRRSACVSMYRSLSFWTSVILRQPYAARHRAGPAGDARTMGNTTERLIHIILCDTTQREHAAVRRPASNRRGGMPRRVLDPGNVRELSGRWGAADAIAYITALMSRRTSQNGVFGLKVMYPDLEEFVRKLAGDLTGQRDLGSRVATLFSSPVHLHDTPGQGPPGVVLEGAPNRGVEQPGGTAWGFPGTLLVRGGQLARLRRAVRAGVASLFRRFKGQPSRGGLRGLRRLVPGDDQAGSRLPWTWLGPHRPEPRLQKQADSLSDARVERFQRGGGRRIPAQRRLGDRCRGAGLRPAVPREARGGHPSGTGVAAGLVRSTRGLGRPPPRPCCAAGASPIRPCSGWGLPSRPVTRPLVRSYRTVSPCCPACAGRRSTLLGGTVLRVAPTGGWPAPRSCGGRTFLDPGEPGPRPLSRLPLPAKYATRTGPRSILGAWSPSWPSPSSSSRWPSWRC